MFRSCTLLALLVLPLAAVELPAVFSDHAVLQAGSDTPVWGTGRDGETIRVAIGAVRAETTVTGGRWMVRLVGLKPSSSGQDLVVRGDTTLTVRDVLIGDVWLSSGQSNMEWRVNQSHNGAEAAAQATDAGIRFFHVPHTTATAPATDVKAQWKIVSPTTVGNFSALSYHFARDLRRTRSQPIGLLGSYWGATSAQSWISSKALTAPPAFSHYLEAKATFMEDYDRLKAAWPETKAAFDAAVARVNATNAATQAAWKQAAADAKANGRKAPAKPKTIPQPKRVYHPDENPNVPTYLFNGMIAPLAPYALTGVLWYQGESNSAAAAEYASLFPRLIHDWRGHWGRDDLPFLFVQVSTWKDPQQSPIEDGDIPRVRQAQLAALALPRTGMTSALDINDGSDIHPANKQIVGERLAQVARRVAYGEMTACDHPSLRGVTRAGNVLRVHLDHAEGLRVAVPPWLGSKAMVPSATAPASLAVCGEDGVWQWASAQIEGSDLLLSSDLVPQPVAAAHAWAPNTAINLYNAAGLPLLPFVSDLARLPTP
jgi:sialate O-acetylesterase